MGNMFLRGGDEAVYSDTALEHDLVSPRLSRDNDPFTKIVINNIILLWHTVIGRRIKQSSEGIYTYSEKWPLRMLRFLSTVVASMLPVAAVFALQGITPKPERYRLGAFAAFTFVFVVLMGLFTGAKRSEIFAAAAASVLTLIVLPSKHRVRLGSSLILLSNTVLRGIKSINLQDLRLAQLSKLAQLIQVYIQGSLLTLPPAQIRRCSSRFHWYEQRQSSLKNSSRDSILAGDILVNAVARYQCGTANLRVPQGWP
jgi:hypothetical protein